MARGEPAPRGRRGPGVAIAVAFGVLCLLALTLVLFTMRACDEIAAPTVPPVDPEPFAGVTAAFAPLGSRGCVEPAGPVTSGPRDAMSEIDASLRARGYQASGDWSEPGPLPNRMLLDPLASSCGVVVAAAEPGGMLTSATAGSTIVQTCRSEVLAVATCGEAIVEITGAGTARTRAYVMPGLTSTDVRESGVPADVILAHAEAEALLARSGFIPSDQLVVVDVAPTGPSWASRAVASPPAPASGCVPWVAVGRDVGSASVTWNSRLIDNDTRSDGFVAGLVVCAPSPSASVHETRLDAVDSDGDGGRVWMRPFEARTGPAVQERAAPATTAGALRVVDAAAVRQPRSVPRLESAAP